MTTHLLGATDVRALATRLGVSPTKKLGQNFMTDPGTVRRIVKLSRITPGTRVVEVGPGLGSLTLGLLEAGAQVSAVEIDPVLAAQLPLTVAEYAPESKGNLTVIQADALRLEADTLQSQAGLTAQDPFCLVSNLPYNVATPILLTFLERFAGLRTALVLVQDEVAERLAAQPGSKIYGAPSVKLAWHGPASKAGAVGRSVFWPVPNVDSSLVAFERRPADQARPEDLQGLTFQLIDAAFAQRRKTLRAALRELATEEQIRSAGIDPTIRGERLAVDDFLALARLVQAAPTAVQSHQRQPARSVAPVAPTA